MEELVMDGKLKSMLIVSILILSALVISTSFGSIADAPPEELGARGPPGSHNYTWMPIEIVSEPVVGQNINTITSESVRIAVENDHIYVVWDDNYAPNGAGPDRDILYRHFDGNSWSNIEVISEPVFGQNINILDSYDPSIAVDGGNVYVIWEDANNTDGASTDYDIFYRCNRGSGWEDIQVISEPEKGYAFNTGSSGTCDIDVENGQIYVVWQDYNQTDGSSSDQDVHFVCNLTGTNWEEIQVISEPVAGQNFNSQNSYDPLISVYNKQVYVLWEDNNNTYGAGTDTDIFVRCNLTGSNWEAVQVVSEPAMTGNTNTGASYDAGFAAYGGNMYAVWEQGWNYKAENKKFAKKSQKA